MAKDYYELANGIQVLDIIPKDEKYIFAKWNLLKYVVRAGNKNDDVAADLEKAHEYLEIMQRIVSPASSQEQQEKKRYEVVISYTDGTKETLVVTATDILDCEIEAEAWVDHRKDVVNIDIIGEVKRKTVKRYTT